MTMEAPELPSKVMPMPPSTTSTTLLSLMATKAPFDLNGDKGTGGRPPLPPKVAGNPHSNGCNFSCGTESDCGSSKRTSGASDTVAKKSVWFSKNPLSCGDQDGPQGFEVEDPAIVPVLSATAKSALAGGFRKPCAAANTVVDSFVVVKMSETAVPLPPAVLVSVRNDDLARPPAARDDGLRRPHSRDCGPHRPDNGRRTSGQAEDSSKYENVVKVSKRLLLLSPLSCRKSFPGLSKFRRSLSPKARKSTSSDQEDNYSGGCSTGANGDKGHHGDKVQHGEPGNHSNSSPKLFSKSDRTFNIPACLVLGPAGVRPSSVTSSFTSPSSAPRSNSAPPSPLGRTGVVEVKDAGGYEGPLPPLEKPYPRNWSLSLDRRDRRRPLPAPPVQQSASNQGGGGLPGCPNAGTSHGLLHDHQGLAPPTMPSAQSTLSVRIETPRASEGMAGTRVPVGGICGRQSRPGGGRGPGGGEDKQAPLRLEDILDMCADYQRQMEAEQQEALRLREQASLQEVSGVSWGHPHQYLSTWPLPPVTSSNAVVNSSFATVGDFNANDADDRYTSATATAAATTAASAAVPAFTGNHGQSTLVGQQWSPTSLAQKRIITNGSLPKDRRRHTSPPPAHSGLSGSAFPGGFPAASRGWTCSGASVVPETQSSTSLPSNSYKMFSSGLGSAPAGGAAPASPILPASESELRTVFGFVDSTGCGVAGGAGAGAARNQGPRPEDDAEARNSSSMSSMYSSPSSRSGIITSPRHHHHHGLGHHQGLVASRDRSRQQLQAIRSPANNYFQFPSTVTSPDNSSTYQGGGEAMYGYLSDFGRPSMGDDEDSMLYAPTCPGPPFVTLGSVPRKPPKSKHDRGFPGIGSGQADQAADIYEDGEALPSREATHRLLIGTVMLQGGQRPCPNTNGSSLLSCGGSTTYPRLTTFSRGHLAERQQDFLRQERKKQLQLVSKLKHQLCDLEQRETEEIGQLDLERSLLNGELSSENEKLRKIRSRLSLLRIQEQRLSGVFEEWQKVASEKIDEAKDRMQAAEEALRLLENQYSRVSPLGSWSTLSEEETSDLLDKLKYQRELVDFERKTFEDMEFHQMEEEAHKQTEREDLIRDISELEKDVKKHEKRLVELDVQLKKVTNSVCSDTQEMEKQRQEVIKKLNEEKAKLSQLESQITVPGPDGSGASPSIYSNQKLVLDHRTGGCVDLSLSDDDEVNGGNLAYLPSQSAGSTWKRDKGDSLGNGGGHPRNPELDEGLRRLALLDRTQNEVEKLTLAVLKLKNSTRTTSKGLEAANNFLAKVPKFTPEKIKGSPLLVLQQQKQIAEELSRVIKAINTSTNNSNSNNNKGAAGLPSSTSTLKNSTSLNSAGSEDGSGTGDSSSADLHTDSGDDELMSSKASSAKNARQSPESDEKLDDDDDQPGYGSSGHNMSGGNCTEDDFSTTTTVTTSRPISETSSTWDEAEFKSDIKRRQSPTSKQQRPLTRYLPIRNDNLNLRLHIETAGHQLEVMYPLVIIDSSTCRGYLHKLGGGTSSSKKALQNGGSSGKFSGLSHTWNKRWFVFDRTKKAFVYYADKTESKAKGGLYFSAIEEVYVDHLNSVKSPNPKVTFAMKTLERTYYFMAPSPEAMRVWVDVIFTGAEGYKEFLQQ